MTDIFNDSRGSSRSVANPDSDLEEVGDNQASVASEEVEDMNVIDRLDAIDRRLDMLVLAIRNNVFAGGDAAAAEDVKDLKEMVGAYSGLLTRAISSPDFDDEDREIIRKSLLGRHEWIVIEQAQERINERNSLREVLDVETESEDFD